MASTMTEDLEELDYMRERGREGRWGPYISFKKGNYKIKKGTDIESLTIADCELIIETEGSKPKTNKRRSK